MTPASVITPVALAGAAVLLVTGLAQPAAAASAGIDLQSAGRGTAAGLAVSRVGTYVAMSCTVGFLIAATALLPTSPRLDATARRAARLVLLSALGWAVAGSALAAFQLSSVAARPLPEALQPDLLGRFAGTRFGTAVVASVAAGLVVAVIALLARTPAALAAALTVTGGATFGPVWWGHAGARENLLALALVSDWVHVVGAVSWVGGLVAVLWLAPRGDDAFPDAVRRFSRLAGWAFGAVLLSGTVNALLNVGAVEQLVDTTWGRLVLVKLAVLATLGWFGHRHRTTVLPRLSEASRTTARQAFRRLGTAEIGLMLVAFGLAASMAGGIPASTEAALRVQSSYVAFGDGQLNLTVDPAETGANVLHVYFLTDDGRQREDVADPRIVFGDGTSTITADLLVAGPGHWTAPSLQFSGPGTWRVAVDAELPTGTTAATSAVTVR